MRGVQSQHTEGPRGSSRARDEQTRLLLSSILPTIIMASTGGNCENVCNYQIDNYWTPCLEDNCPQIGDMCNPVNATTCVCSNDCQMCVDDLYNEIVSVGTHKAPSIKVAEAAKVIENTQRDVNIALINELAMIFNQLGLDTKEVLNAARTKWNWCARPDG